MTYSKQETVDHLEVMGPTDSGSYYHDNASPVHPEIFRAMQQVNVRAFETGLAPYGLDDVTTQAVKVLRSHFGPDADIHFVPTGTAANILGVAAYLNSGDELLCSDISHIRIDECNALQRFAGTGITGIPSIQGKIRAKDLIQLLDGGHGTGWFHHSSPRVISLTQPTEVGTVYGLDEIRQIVEVAHAHGMFVHIDGARLSLAAERLKCTLKGLTFELGVDVISLGISKCGALGGNAIIFPDRRRSPYFKRLQKQGMALLDRSWQLSLQFAVMFESELWRENSRHAIQMAKYLERKLQELDLQPAYPVDTNAVFFRMAPEIVELLKGRHYFYVWDQASNLVRIMTSFATTFKQLDVLSRDIAEALAQPESVLTAPQHIRSGSDCPEMKVLSVSTC